MLKNTFVSSVPDGFFFYRNPCLIHSLAVSPSVGGHCAASVHENTKHFVISIHIETDRNQTPGQFFYHT